MFGIAIIVILLLVVLLLGNPTKAEREQERREAEAKRQSQQRYLARLGEKLNRSLSQWDPSWQTYQDYLASDVWKQKRAVVLEKHNHRCQGPGCTAHATQVHHTKYPRLWGTEPLDWLVPLCSSCHAREHGKLPSETSEDELEQAIREMRERGDKFPWET